MIRTIHKIIQCLNKGFQIRAALLCDIPFERLPRSTIISHPIGIVIGDDTVFGENCRIRQNVTIGRRYEKKKFGNITIGNNVDIGNGAIIIGHDLTIGDNCLIGAGAIVLKSVPSNTTVVGIWK